MSDTEASGAPRTAVITTVHGRHRHLVRQQRHLAASGQDALRVVVAMADPDLDGLLHDQGLGDGAVVVPLEADPADLPLSAARNLGARTAMAHGCEVLVFLDVDVIPGPHTVGRYAEVLADDPELLAAGAVTYLAEGSLPPGDGLVPQHLLDHLRSPHPARPDPGPDHSGEVLPEPDHRLFWSLSFALTSRLWERLGGFDEAFVGYGGEDTDFAYRARAAGVELGWVPGADGWHQWHPVEDPPVRHLEAICRNAQLFRDRHGEWPMTGWLAAFEDLGLIEVEPDRIRLVPVASAPADPVAACLPRPEAG